MRDADHSPPGAEEILAVVAGHRDRGRARDRPHRRAGRSCSTRSRRRSPASRSTTATSSRSGPTSSPTCWPRTVSSTASASCTTWCSASSCCGRSRSWSRTASPRTREALGVDGRLRARRPPLRAGRVRPGVDGPAAQRLRRARARGRATTSALHAPVGSTARSRPPPLDPTLEATVARVRRLSHRDTLGRRSGRCTTAAGSRSPGTPGARRRILAQHDFVHVLADYGTNLEG